MKLVWGDRYSKGIRCYRSLLGACVQQAYTVDRFPVVLYRPFPCIPLRRLYAPEHEGHLVHEPPVQVCVLLATRTFSPVQGIQVQVPAPVGGHKRSQKLRPVLSAHRLPGTFEGDDNPAVFGFCLHRFADDDGVPAFLHGHDIFPAVRQLK